MKESKFAFRNAVRKIAAVGAGASMVGATILGAAAQDLSEYPAPFVQDGKFNAILVIGENAKTIDVVGATSIATSLQFVSTEEVSVGGTPTGATSLALSGDAVEIGEPSDLLEIGEPIGDVRETVTEFELDALKGGVITTDQGSTEYNQYLRFKDTNNQIASGRNGESGRVVYDENDERNEKVGDFLFFQEGDNVTNDAMFEFEIEFEEGLESEEEAITVGNTPVSKFKLDDLEDEVFNMFGTDYTIVKAEFSPGSREISLEFLGGDVVDTMEEGEIKTYTIDGVDYEVEVLIISDASEEVKFKVNGEITDELQDGETDVLSDGLEIGVREVLSNEAEEVSGGDIVEFFLGANKIQFKDNFSDTAFSRNVEITEEDIEEAFVRIVGNELVVNDTLEISSIRYRLTADARAGQSDIFIPPGHGLREFLDEPEGMLNPDWDIRYEGLIDTGVSTILVDSNGDDEYTLKFTNRQGNDYSVPFVDNSASNDDNTDTNGLVGLGTFKLGEDADTNKRNNLVFVEGFVSGSNTSIAFFNIFDDDMFILSDMDDEWDETATSHVLIYENFDTSNRELTFEDLATGTQEIAVDITSTNNFTYGTGSLIVGGNTFSVFVANTSTGANSSLTGAGSFALAIDQNNDGDVGAVDTGTTFRYGAERAKITVHGGGILDFENHNGTAGSQLGFDKSIGAGTVINYNESYRKIANNTLNSQVNLSGNVIAFLNASGLGNNINNTFNITLHTEGSEFDENDGGEEIFITIQNSANNEVGLNVIETNFRTAKNIGTNSSYCYTDGSATTATVEPVPTLGIQAPSCASNSTTQNNGLTQLIYDFKLNEPDENEDFNLGMSTYGILFSVFDEDQASEPEELTIEYPLLQRGAHVFVTAGDVSSKRVGAGGGAVIINKIDVGKTLLDSEVADVTAQNAIVVGGPCVNTGAADLLGNPENCAEGFTPGEATLQLFENGGNVALLVAGYSGEDTRQAAYVLSEYDKYALSGEKVVINTQSLQVTTVG